MQTIQEQKAELTAAYKEVGQTKISDALYITLVSALNAQLGTEFRREGIMLNVNPVAEAVKDKKVRGGANIVGGGNKIKGGLVNLSGAVDGAVINKLYMNVQTVQWIVKHGSEILEYLAQDHMTYRKIGQTTVEEGQLTATELFGVEA